MRENTFVGRIMIRPQESSYKYEIKEITPAPPRIGEDEPPPSWDPVATPPTLAAMVGKSSPKLPLMGSPKIRKFLATSSAGKKKPSPKCGGRAKKQRAYWNPALEKSLVEILHKYKDSGYRGDNGWTTEGWNVIVKEFLEKNKDISFSRLQIQDKEGQMKRDYKMLKEARKQSGGSWNHDKNMIEGSEAFWDNLMVTWPNIKKHNNSKATFPLFDTLGELYDGQLAEGTYNVISLESPPHEEPLHQVQYVQPPEIENEVQDLDAINDIEDEDEALDGRRVDTRSRDARDSESSAAAVARSGQQRTMATSKKVEKEEKRPKKGERLEAMMEQYIEIKKKQTEAEIEHLAKEKEVQQGSDFSIKRCITVLASMEVSKEEEAKANNVFIKSKENREAFLSSWELDPEIALIWLRSELA